MTTRRTSAAIYCVVTLVACCFLPAARGFHLSSPSLLPAAASQQLKAGSSARTAQFTPASFAARSLQGTLRKQRTGGTSIFLGGLNAVLSDKKDTKQAPGAPPKTVLVVGGGLGGVSVTYDVKHRMRSQDKVILLSDRSTFDFTPSNPWVAVRFRKPKDIQVDLATTMPKHGVEFELGAAVKCDPDNGEVHTSTGKIIKFDYLIIATGAYLNFDCVPGVKEHAVSVCTTGHALHAADKWDEFMARKEPGDIVVGCMQGASCFGPGYEFVLMLENELRKHHKRDTTKITFLTSEPYVGHLGLAGVGGSAKELTKILKERGVSFVENVKIDEMTADKIHYTKVGPEGETKHSIDSDYSMFIPQFRGQPVWEDVPGLTAPNGMVLVDEHMRSLKYDNVFAIGIAVSLPKVEETPVATGAPKTGFMIESMGTCAADNIRAQVDAELAGEDVHEASKEMPSLSALCITDFGDTGAVALAIPQFAPRRADLHIINPLVRLAKISFEQYFLYKVKTGDCDPYYEKWLLNLVGLKRLSDEHVAPEILKQDISPLPKRGTETAQRGFPEH